MPHCNEYDTNVGKSDTFCKSCHQTYKNSKLPSSFVYTYLNLYFTYTYVAYYDPDGSSIIKACLKVPREYDDHPSDYNKVLSFSAYGGGETVSQGANAGLEGDIKCKTTTSIYKKFDTDNNKLADGAASFAHIGCY